MAHKNAKKHKSWSGGGCKSGLNQTAASCGLHFTKQDSALYEGTVFFADSESCGVALWWNVWQVKETKWLVRALASAIKVSIACKSCVNSAMFKLLQFI